MNVCLVLPLDQSPRSVRLDQRELSQYLGGPITFVGALHDLDAVVIATTTATEPHPLSLPTSACRHVFFDTPAHGTLLVVASDEDGQAVDLDVAKVCLEMGLCAPE